MGQKLSFTELKSTIENDLGNDLEIRYLFALSNSIKQFGTKAVCKVKEDSF